MDSSPVKNERPYAVIGAAMAVHAGGRRISCSKPPIDFDKFRIYPLPKATAGYSNTHKVQEAIHILQESFSG